MSSYKHVRDKVNALNRKLKKDFYLNKINENLGDLKQTWKIVNGIVDKASKTTKIDSIKIENKFITDNKNIPGIMNRYFCSVWETFKAKIPQ